MAANNDSYGVKEEVTEESQLAFESRSDRYNEDHLHKVIRSGFPSKRRRMSP